MSKEVCVRVEDTNTLNRMNSTNITSDNNGTCTLSRNVLHGAFSIVVTSLTFISVGTYNDQKG